MSFSLSGLPNLVPVSSQPSASSSSLPESSNTAMYTPYVAHTQEPDPAKPAVLWHAQAGLVVSLNSTYIPETMSDGASKHRNYTRPTLLDDGEIYLAFTPRYVRNDGDLFGRLNLNRAALDQKIKPLNNGTFILDADTIESWARLENGLLDLVDTLLRSLQPRPPALEYPKFPFQCGYRDAHENRDKTLRFVLNSQKAFLSLAAVTTFSLSLYMDGSGGLYPAYATLKRKSVYDVHPAWWDLLVSSYVCNFSPNFRVGGFVNPYQSQWMGHVTKFVQARVPIWILWGHNHRVVAPTSRFAFYYSPPEHLIKQAQDRSTAFESTILPTYRYDPFASSQGLRQIFQGTSSSDGDVSMDLGQPEWAVTPAHFEDIDSASFSEMPAPSPASSLQSEETKKKQALEALQKFFADVERRREEYLKNELPEDKTRRVAREETAKKSGIMRKSTVFVWQEQEDGTYRRVKVNSKQVEDEWSNVTRNQRRYTGHLNQWDLCPQFPRYSEENPKEPGHHDSDDSECGSDNDELDPLPSTSKATIEIPNDGHGGATFIDDLRSLALDADDRPDASRREEFVFETYLRDRFGYDLMSPENWNSNIAPAEDPERVTFDKAMSGLSCMTAPGYPNVQEAVIRLFQHLSTTNKTYKDLPASFDYSTASSTPFSLESHTLDITLAPQPERIVYVVHGKGYIDHHPWLIATSDASTVLLIFRRRWVNVHEIARELVKRGVPFRTVAAVTVAPAPIPFLPVRGLGARPTGYTPTTEDYLQYLQRREDLLRGPKGRAALMRGGIVGRIARDVIEVNIVVDGPSTGASAVAEYGRFTLVDDELTDNDVDIICGVYYVEIENAPKGGSFLPGTRKHLSWWPRDSTWVSAATYSQLEWTERAEDFYQTHLQALRTTPKTALMGSTAWKRSLRKFSTLTKKVDIGAMHYPGGYVEDHHHRTRFVARSR